MSHLCRECSQLPTVLLWSSSSASPAQREEIGRDDDTKDKNKPASHTFDSLRTLWTHHGWDVRQSCHEAKSPNSHFLSWKCLEATAAKTLIPPEILTENESYPTVGGQDGFIKMLTAASAKKETPVFDCCPKGSWRPVAVTVLYFLSILKPSYKQKRDERKWEAEMWQNKLIERKMVWHLLLIIVVYESTLSLWVLDLLVGRKRQFDDINLELEIKMCIEIL